MNPQKIVLNNSSLLCSTVSHRCGRETKGPKAEYHTAPPITHSDIGEERPPQLPSRDCNPRPPAQPTIGQFQPAIDKEGPKFGMALACGREGNPGIGLPWGLMISTPRGPGAALPFPTIVLCLECSISARTPTAAPPALYSYQLLIMG
jgi:hypothetical protein